MKKNIKIVVIFLILIVLLLSSCSIIPGASYLYITNECGSYRVFRVVGVDNDGVDNLYLNDGEKDSLLVLSDSNYKIYVRTERTDYIFWKEVHVGGVNKYLTYY